MTPQQDPVRARRNLIGRSHAIITHCTKVRWGPKVRSDKRRDDGKWYWFTLRHCNVVSYYCVTTPHGNSEPLSLSRMYTTWDSRQSIGGQPIFNHWLWGFNLSDLWLMEMRLDYPPIKRETEPPDVLNAKASALLSSPHSSDQCLLWPSVPQGSSYAPNGRCPGCPLRHSISRRTTIGLYHAHSRPAALGGGYQLMYSRNKPVNSSLMIR